MTLAQSAAILRTLRRGLAAGLAVQVSYEADPPVVTIGDVAFRIEANGKVRLDADRPEGTRTRSVR